MITTSPFRFPETADRAFQKAYKLEWLTIGYMVSRVALIYFVMGSSQALKSAWVQEMLSLLPPFAFLIAARYYRKKPNDRFPYGYHRVFQIAYLSASLAIFIMGVLLIIDSTRALITAQHPTLGSVVLFDHVIWIGWLAILVLMYKAIPAYFLGKRKLHLAKLSEDQILHTDAMAQKLSYQTATAAAAGILGIGMGWWWADEVVAYFISFTVLKEGFNNARIAIFNLMDSYPMDKVTEEVQEDVEKIQQETENQEWVKQAGIRLRQQGHVLFGEIWVVPEKEEGLLENIEQFRKKLQKKYWRLHDVVIAPVNTLKN
jgi:cation diffusion facilitator family transporter